MTIEKIIKRLEHSIEFYDNLLEECKKDCGDNNINMSLVRSDCYKTTRNTLRNILIYCKDSQ